MLPHSALTTKCAATILIASLLGCGGSGEAPTGVTPTAASTPRGSASGSPVSAVIGAAGGRVVSNDAVLAIDIPAGAFASNVTVTVQPVTNTAPGGFAPAYRLGPEGQTFVRPVTLTFALPSNVVESVDVNSATIASQQADGTWLPASTTRNATSFSVTTTHFSDWTVISNLWIDPPFAAVDLGNSRNFTANFCPRNGDVVPQCTAAGATLAWSLIGVGGGAVLGTVTSAGTQATYRAPSSAPTGASVKLLARATTTNNAQVTALANIQIGRQNSWNGTVEVTAASAVAGGTTIVTSIANVSFRWNAGQMAYTPNGNMNVNYDVINTAGNCETHLTGGRSIVDGDGNLTTSSVGAQAYYTGAGYVSTSFTLSGTTNCNDQRQTRPMTLDQTGYGWWPAISPGSGQPGFPVRNNGTVMEEDIQIPQVNTRVKWRLLPGQ